MKLNINVLNAVFSGIACIATLATTVDQIKNANKRAYIAGDAAGRAVVDETEKRHKKTIFGATIEEA